MGKGRRRKFKEGVEAPVTYHMRISRPKSGLARVPLALRDRVLNAKGLRRAHVVPTQTSPHLL